MKKFNLTDLIAVATAAYCIVKMASSITSRRRSVKAIVKRGEEVVATTSHDLSVSPAIPDP
jgi:hypothetical protein